MKQQLAALLLATPFALYANTPDRAPRLIHRVEPEYPAIFKEQGVIGGANLRCLIDENGAVQDVSIESATREEFGQAAMAAFRQFKYEPGVKGGRATGMQSRLSIEFSLGAQMLAEREAKRPKEALPPGPPVLPMDGVEVLPELKKEIRPKVPAILRQNRRLGQTLMGFTVDEAGAARDIHVVVTTDPECATAAQEVIQRWRFTPGSKDGQAVRVTMEVQIMFFPEDAWASGLRLRPGVTRDVVGAPVYKGRLDQPPRPIKVGGISYPEEMRSRRIEGNVVVEFIINEQGEVSRVRAVDQTNAFFAALVERQVSYWRFHPARAGGKPVSILAKQRVEFAF